MERNLFAPEKFRIIPPLSQIPRRIGSPPLTSSAPIASEIERVSNSKLAITARQTAKRRKPPEMGIDDTQEEKRHKQGSRTTSSDSSSTESTPPSPTPEREIVNTRYSQPPESPSPIRSSYGIRDKEQESTQDSDDPTQDMDTEHIPGPSTAPNSYARIVATPRSTQPTPPTTRLTPPIEAPTMAKYPPIIVECFPDWTKHFKILQQILGHAPNTRPFGKGVSFRPQTEQEYRRIQKYLVDISKEDSTFVWLCYASREEQPTKMGLRGLPADTGFTEIQEALIQLDFPVTYVRAIPSKRERPGCLFYIKMDHLSTEELNQLY
ncbi:unnamed protein product [Parnassius mnemosyne]|uniref:Uncharacterized protein n=1 Tax=Parnassius mnemosyne TaxID=213953 RepID=A0AAV1LG30_9NEOP